MSNGNEFERLWKLETMVNKMVLDGKRRPNEVCATLQRIVTGELPKGSFEERLEVFAHCAKELSTRIGELDPPLPKEDVAALRKVNIRYLGDVVQLSLERVNAVAGLSETGAKLLHETVLKRGLHYETVLNETVLSVFWIMKEWERRQNIVWHYVEALLVPLDSLGLPATTIAKLREHRFWCVGDWYCASFRDREDFLEGLKPGESARSLIFEKDEVTKAATAALKKADAYPVPGHRDYMTGAVVLNEEVGRVFAEARATCFQAA